VSLLGKIFGLTPKKPPVSITDENFETEVLAATVPVLLDVWGTSCGPCRQLESVIMDLSAHYDGRVKVCELNAHVHHASVQRLQIQHTPTVIYFHGGKELERHHGFRPSLYPKQTINELFGIDA